MDYYQGVVLNYLRSFPSVFVNPEYCIQLNDVKYPAKGEHWYCDAVALDLSSKTALLCETSYAANLQALLSRLKHWNVCWDGICCAIKRDACLSPEEHWTFRPMAFVPKCKIELLNKRMGEIKKTTPLKFDYLTVPLEAVQPWAFPEWNRESKLLEALKSLHTIDKSDCASSQNQLSGMFMPV